MVIPADGFMAGFGKMACLGLQNILGDCDVVCKNRDINQACALKKKLESLNLREVEVSIFSLDVEFFLSHFFIEIR